MKILQIAIILFLFSTVTANIFTDIYDTVKTKFEEFKENGNQKIKELLVTVDDWRLKFCIRVKLWQLEYEGTWQEITNSILFTALQCPE